MKTLTVEKIDLLARQSFDDVRAAFEKVVPAADLAAMTKLITSHASRHEIEETVRSMTGDSGFMILGRIDQGPLTSLLGKPKHMTTYLVGNPVLATRMFDQNPGVSHYAPVRVSIYEDFQGRTHFTYEQPSSLLAQFDDGEIRAVGKILDEKLASLAQALTL
jgi:uncharacterized protein (DUF302 family)